MSQDLSALELYCKTILDAAPWERDPNVFNIPWREITLPEKLCFGKCSWTWANRADNQVS
jgi:amidase